MKFKRLLAAILSAMMITSCMSFVADAQEAETEADIEAIEDIVVEEIEEEAEEEAGDVAEEATLAEETAETVTITFDKQNGAYIKKDINGDGKADHVSQTVSTAEVVVGEAISFPEAGEYIHHTFKGWSTEKNGAVIEDTSNVIATEAKTYYGVWEWNLAKGTPVEAIYARTEQNYMATENGKSGGIFYDATTGTVYKRFLNVAGKSLVRCNMYSGLKYSLPGSEFHMVALVRTNMTDGGKPSIGVYSSSKKSGDSFSVGTIYSSYDFSDGDSDQWKTVHLSSEAFANFGIGTHIDFNVVGGAPIKDVENDYFDVAGIALFGTSEEVTAFDIAGATAYTGTAVVSFDAQTAEDDSDVTTKYPASLTREGYKLAGWATDAEGTTLVDITKVPVPTANVTYYAIWDKVHTINFHKNDGSDTVETYNIVNGDAITAPTFTVDGKTFLGWATSADSTEIAEVDATASANKDYYAVWTSMWLTELIVNGNDFDASTKSGKLYGIDDLSGSYRLDLVMPYDYPTSVVPTISGTANTGTVTYTAPETFDGTGSVTITSGETSVVLPVTFTVADKSTVKDLNFVPTEGVNSTGRGLYAITKSTDKGISATKFIPIYNVESDYYNKITDEGGTVTGGYLPEKYVNIEGWAAFNGNTGVNLESYDQYRALIYYDAGENRKRDVTTVPSITHTYYGTRGPLRNKVASLVSGEYKTGRWEYAYFDLDSLNDGVVYGWSKQFSISLLGNTQAMNFTDDVLYVAKIDLLVDGDEKFLQYKPTELSVTDETSAKNDGTISGVTSDMEVSVDGGEYVAITTFAGFDAENRVLGGLDGATYSLRYAGSETHAASEAVELTVVSYDAELTFYSNIDDTTTVFAEKEVPKGATVDVLPLISDIKNADHATFANDIVARPARQGYILKGWASSAEATEPEEIDTTKSGKYYAVWEAIPEANILTANEDYTLTIVDGVEVTASPVPADALSFYRGDEAGSFMTNSEGITYGTTPEEMTNFKGVSLTDKTTIASWYGGNSLNTVLYPDGRATNIWYKLNDSYISAEPGVEGEYYISYHISTGSKDSIRAFTLDVPGKNGVVYLTGTNVEGELVKDHFVTVRADLTTDSELKYSAALDFDDEYVKGAQLLGIYIWPTEKQALKNKYGEDAEIVFVSNAGAGTKDGSSPENAMKGLFSGAMPNKANSNVKTVFAVIDDVYESLGYDSNFPVDSVITSVGGNLYVTKHPKLKSNRGGSLLMEDIDIYHAPAAGASNINGEIYFVTQGNDLTLRNVDAHPFSNDEGKTRTATLYVQPGGDGGNFTKTADTKLVIENVTGITVRGGGYGGSTFAGGIDYVVGGKSEFSNILAGIQAAGSSAQKTVNDVLQFDADGNPVTNQPEANRTVNGDIAVAVKDEAKITTITATNYGILKGDLVITVQDDATVGTIDFAASSVKKKNQAGDADVVMSAGRLEGNGIVYILGGSVGTVKGTQGKKRAIVVDLNNAVVPEYIANVNNIVTYEGNGTVTIEYAEDGTASIALEPGAGVKYIRITNGDNVKSYTVNGDEVTLLEEVDFKAIELSEGTTTVEFLEDATEATTVTFNANGGTFASTGTDTLTVDLAIGSTVTGETVEKPTKANAIFAGWTPADAVVTAGIVYTANWTPAYDIKFVVNGEETAQQYLENESVTFPTITVTEDDKKTFLGWSTVSATDKENLITDTSAITAIEDKTYYAVIVNWPIVTYRWAGYEHSKQYVYGTKIDFFPSSMADKNYRYDFLGWQDGDNIYTSTDNAPALTEDVTYVGLFSEEGVEITAESVTRLYDSIDIAQVNNGTKRFIQTKGQTIDGVTASMITPNAEVIETDNKAILLEGVGQFPANNSYADNSTCINLNTYSYIVVKYYYEPGTATATRNMGLWLQKEPYQTNPGAAVGDLSVPMTADKWTYAIYELPAGKQPSSQYHLKPFANVNIGTLATTGEVIYLHSLTVFKEQPTLATVTFKGENGEVLYAIDALNSEAVTYNGAAVEKADHTFKGWAIEGTTEVVEALTFAQDTILVPVFEENPQEVFPTTPTYKTYGKYDASAGIYEVELKLSGTTGNVGSFGFTFPTEYMTLKSVTANAEAGVVLLSEEASEVAQPSPIFVKENGNYANTWTAELATGYGYVDATTEEVLIATFTFDMTADQRTAFKTAVVDTNGKFAEYAVADADEKYYKDGKYLVAPYSADLSTNKVGIDYVSHTDEEGEVEVTTATITLTVDLHDDRGTVGTSLATLAVNGGEAVVIEQADVGGDITYTISGLEIGKPCTISVKKNGYVEGLCVITPTAASNTLTMKLVAGDIKGAADAVCGDGVINLDDFVRVIRAFDPDASDGFKESMDIDENGYVNVADLAFIKKNYGQKIGNATITFNGGTVTPGTEA